MTSQSYNPPIGLNLNVIRSWDDTRKDEIADISGQKFVLGDRRGCCFHGKNDSLELERGEGKPYGRNSGAIATLALHLTDTTAAQTLERRGGALGNLAEIASDLGQAPLALIHVKKPSRAPKEPGWVGIRKASSGI